MIYIGIDPGLSGAVAIISPTKAQVFKMPIRTTTKMLSKNKKKKKNEVDGSALAKIIYSYSLFDAEHNEEIFCIIEKSSPMPGQGVTSMFNYGVTYGKILGILETSDILYKEVPPATWKKYFKLSKDKNDSIIEASKLFPKLKNELTTPRGRILDGNAEALLLAEYARREYNK